MSVGAAIFPALAGYWIVSRTHLFQPRVAKTPTYAFLFECAVQGVAAATIATAIAFAYHAVTCPCSDAPPAEFLPWWQDQITLNDPSTAIVLLALALATPLIVNLLFPAREVARKWRVPNESPVDRVLREAHEHRPLRLVELVTTSGDSYIGRVVGPRYPWEWPDDVLIVPYLIGYRDPGTRAFVLNDRDVSTKRRSTFAFPRASVLSVATVFPGSLAPPRARVTRTP